MYKQFNYNSIKKSINERKNKKESFSMNFNQDYFQMNGYKKFNQIFRKFN